VRACEAFMDEREFGVWLQASRARRAGAGDRSRATVKGGGAGNGLRVGGGTCEGRVSAQETVANGPPTRDRPAVDGVAGRAASEGGVGGGESQVMNAAIERQGGEDCAWDSSGFRVSECSLRCSWRALCGKMERHDRDVGEVISREHVCTAYMMFWIASMYACSHTHTHTHAHIHTHKHSCTGMQAPHT
jgi:hypothetical protein